jgi:seryl-tRNA synthetase
VTEKDVEEVQQGLEAVQITGSEVQRLQEKQRAAVQRAVRQRTLPEDGTTGSPLHPDLQDLSFGELGSEQRYIGRVIPQFYTLNHRDRNLQPPLRPNRRSSHDDREYSHGSLSDFSDYESSDEETYRGAGGPSGSHPRKTYINVSDNDDEDEDARRHITVDEDPFADPFAD